jgi:hypothetical protein
MNTLLAERDRIRGWWMGRTDNEWPAVAGDVVQRVDDLLSGTFPAFAR